MARYGDSKAIAAAAPATNFIFCRPAAVRTKTNRPSSPPRFTGPFRTPPLALTSAVPFRCEVIKAATGSKHPSRPAALSGFDPEEHWRLGIFTLSVNELGEQTLGVGHEFPFGEDPSLWDTLN